MDAYLIQHLAWIQQLVEVQVDFEVGIMGETDFHSIRRLLQQAFLKTSEEASLNSQHCSATIANQQLFLINA